MNDLFFWSRNRKFGLRIGQENVAKLLEFCKQSPSIETGGILVGSYISDQSCANIVEVTGPPEDSRSGDTWFYRGVKGLQSWLNKLWKEQGLYYLGEWHFHPNASALPSDIDIRQMVKISKSSKYHCPEPLLIIIGGNPFLLCKMKVFVFHGSDDYVELYQE